MERNYYGSEIHSTAQKKNILAKQVLFDPVGPQDYALANTPIVPEASFLHQINEVAKNTS